MASVQTGIASRTTRNSGFLMTERETDHEAIWGASSYKSSQPDISDMLRFALGYSTVSVSDYIHTAEDATSASTWSPCQLDVFTANTASRSITHSIPRRLSLSTKLVPTAKPVAGSETSPSTRAATAYGRKILKPKPPSMSMHGVRSHVQEDACRPGSRSSANDGPSRSRKHGNSRRKVPEHSVPRRIVCWR